MVILPDALLVWLWRIRLAGTGKAIGRKVLDTGTNGLLAILLHSLYQHRTHKNTAKALKVKKMTNNDSLNTGLTKKVIITGPAVSALERRKENNNHKKSSYGQFSTNMKLVQKTLVTEFKKLSIAAAI
jgi:hypothetical protein